MKHINQEAGKILDTLTLGMDKAGDRKKIDNTKGAFMAVHVEYIGREGDNKIFSITHYYKQNGDLMRDPEMEFIRDRFGNWYPISFLQDAPLVRDEPITWQGGLIVTCGEKKQAKLTAFSNMWMKNIHRQQGLMSHLVHAVDDRTTPEAKEEE